MKNEQFSYIIYIYTEISNIYLKIMIISNKT